MCQHCYARARFTEWPTLEGKNVLFYCANTLHNIDTGDSIIIEWKISKNKCTLHGKSFKMNATLSSDAICFCVFSIRYFPYIFGIFKTACSWLHKWSCLYCRIWLELVIFFRIAAEIEQMLVKICDRINDSELIQACDHVLVQPIYR